MLNPCWYKKKHMLPFFCFWVWGRFHGRMHVMNRYKCPADWAIKLRRGGAGQSLGSPNSFFLARREPLRAVVVTREIIAPLSCLLFSESYTMFWKKQRFRISAGSRSVSSTPVCDSGQSANVPWPRVSRTGEDYPEFRWDGENGSFCPQYFTSNLVPRIFLNL